jgi:hypothetical protein
VSCEETNGNEKKRKKRMSSRTVDEERGREREWKRGELVSFSWDG